jgi:hypothetical protein
MASTPQPISNRTTVPNPLLQLSPLAPAMPAIFQNQEITTPPVNSGPTISVAELEDQIQTRDQLILSRLRLENAQIADYISILQNQRTTDKSSLVSNSYYFDLINNIYTPLFFVYFLCLIVLGFVFFMTDNDMSLSMRILLMVIFILYPFVIEYLEDYIISWVAFLVRFVQFTPAGTNPIKTATESQPFLFSQRFGLSQ